MSDDQVPFSSHSHRVSILLYDIVLSLVDSPEWVDLQHFETDEETVFSLKVAAWDMANVIGKDGRTLRSIRAILTCVGTKGGHRYALDVETNKMRTH